MTEFSDLDSKYSALVGVVYLYLSKLVKEKLQKNKFPL